MITLFKNDKAYVRWTFTDAVEDMVYGISETALYYCKYRLDRAWCTAIECMLSGQRVHSFRMANQSFDLLNYPINTSKIYVNEGFIPPKAMSLIYILMYYSLCTGPRKPCTKTPCSVLCLVGIYNYFKYIVIAFGVQGK